MYQPKITELKHTMEKIVASFGDDLQMLRTGRASPALVEDVSVSYYGTPTPLKHIGSISSPDPHLIVISPWDKSVLGEIETAVRLSELGLSPVNDGAVIRLSIPPMTEDRRKELVKKLHQMAEEVKVALRATRRDVWDAIQKMEPTGEISEDDRYAAEKELNTIIDDYDTKVDEMVAAKDREIMTV